MRYDVPLSDVVTLSGVEAPPFDFAQDDFLTFYISSGLTGLYNVNEAIIAYRHPPE